MSYTNGLDKPSNYFNTITWTADGTSPRSFTGVGFQPDFVWGKRRSVAADHNLYDVVRGAGSNKALMSNSTDAEGNASPSFGYLSSLDSDGFTATTGSTNNNYWNNGTDTYVAWNWLASNTTASNTDGNVNTTISVNTTSGFSIISANTGSTTGELTLGHGLNAIPSMFIWKNRDDAGQNWQVYHKSTGTGLMRLNDNGAVNNDVVFWNTHTTSLFKMSTHMYSQNKNFIGYCFAEKKGFSKMGSYTGNGNADGTFIYTGFKPAFVMIKKTTGTDGWWQIEDNKRSPENVAIKAIFANVSDTEYSGANYATDYLSNGFKIRNSTAGSNTSGQLYIYMAFAENPFTTSTGVPATAR